MTAAPHLSFSRQICAVAKDIKLSHTVFALPFALLATFLAAGSVDRLPRVSEFFLILLCMITARTFAMAFNRLADAGIDADNKRTQNRALPSGRVRVGTMRGVVLISAVGFVVCTVLFIPLSGNVAPVSLSLPVLAVLAGYSLTKRFTLLCHGFLGVALAISPVAAALAIEPGYLVDPAVWLLSAMVLCWVAGFDIIYALQDTTVDRELGLHSIPSRLGVGPALWISRALHAVAALALGALASVSERLGFFFAFAAGLTVALLVFEHALVWRGRTKQLNMAFFTVNGVISVMLGVAGIADVLLSLD